MGINRFATPPATAISDGSTVVFPPFPDGFVSDTVPRWRVPLWVQNRRSFFALVAVDMVLLAFGFGSPGTLIGPWLGVAVGVAVAARSERSHFTAGPLGIAVGGQYAVPWSRVSRIDRGVLVLDPPLTAPRSLSLSGRWPRVRAASARWRDEPLGAAAAHYAPRLLEQQR